MAELLTFDQWMAAQPPQTFGQSVTYAIGSTDGDGSSRRVLGFSMPHHLARPWGISLGPPPRAVPVGGGVSALAGAQSVDVRLARCVLEWGCGGFSQSLEVDWRQGGQFTLYASAITVACRMPVASTQEVRLGAAVCATFGGVPNRGTLTTNLGQLLLGTSVTTTIPRGAINVLLHGQRGNPVTGIPYSYQWLRSDSSGISNCAVNANANLTGYNQAIPVPVPTEATAVTVTNESATASFNSVTLQFGLAF